MGLIAACGGDAGSGSGPTGLAGMTAPPIGGAGTPAIAGMSGLAGRAAAGSSGAGRTGSGTAGIGTPPAAGAVAAGSGGTGIAGAVAAGSGGVSGAVAAGSGGTGGAMTAGSGGAGGAGGAMMAGSGGAAGSTSMGTGMCCDDGDCICREPPPSALTSEEGNYTTKSYTIPGAGCVYYPTDAEPPFAAVAISDGFLGAGGCGFAQTSGWGPFYASHGIVTMIIDTAGGDQPATRGRKLTAAIAAFKAENMKSGSPLNGKLAGRYGTSGFSMGGGGTSYSSQDDATLKSSVAIMPWGPVTRGIEVPTLVICGSADGIAPCAAHGNPLYSGIGADVPKMRVTVSSGHSGQPSAGGGNSGKIGLAFQKLFLEGDERWRPLLVGADSDQTNIQ